MSHSRHGCEASPQILGGLIKSVQNSKKKDKGVCVFTFVWLLKLEFAVGKCREGKTNATMLSML